MSHLGERITTLVDGQLGVDAAERALMHIAGCTECRDAVELERLTKQRLASLGVPPASCDLIQRLARMAGPSGPLPPRPGHVPGSPRPQLTSASGLGSGFDGAGLAAGADLGGGAGFGSGVLLGESARVVVAAGAVSRPPGRRGSSRPPLVRAATVGRMVRVTRSSRNRMAAAMVGAVCLVGAGVAGGVANGGIADQRISPPVDSFVREHSAATSNPPFSDQTVEWGLVVAGR
jgi:hypothetical protein